ncbi:MAG TPA: 3-dehydroquinate synthase family protein, partial [Anaerolineales bacterium]
MAARIPVHLAHNPYEVIVGSDIVPRIGEFVSQIFTPRKCALVTDSNVEPLYAERVEASLLGAGFEVTRIVVPAGEASKSLATVEEVCEGMVAGGLDRGSFVLALGGGVVGDLAGFAASIYYRGIPHVQVPTTVVAQVDSSIGGKTGVNSKKGKNLIGAFHQPALVITDTDLLKTLPAREFNEGFAEIIKHAAIREAEMLDET